VEKLIDVPRIDDLLPGDGLPILTGGAQTGCAYIIARCCGGNEGLAGRARVSA
jgi:hypothetical protein